MDVSDELGRALGGRVLGFQRLAGGASRITSAFDLETAGGAIRPLVLSQERGDGLSGGRVVVEAALLEAAGLAGVPAPKVVAAGAAAGLEPGWLVVERLEGETIPRKLLRDPEWAVALEGLTAQCGAALAAIHTIDPSGVTGLPARDPFEDPLPLLDLTGELRPCLELGARWLVRRRPPMPRRVTVHGDFRMGNLLVGPEGLRGVLDWELAHAGDPAEDIGWLTSRAWRFGGTGPVGGFGELEELLEAYSAAGGDRIETERIHWWQVYASVKWAVICALQALAHLNGTIRSLELAAIGRRICESEWDIAVLLGLAPEVGDDAPTAHPDPASVTPPFGRPTSRELLDAVAEHLEGLPAGEGQRSRFETRVARNALRTVAREMAIGPAIAAAHGERLAALGFGDDASLAAAIRSGALDDRFDEVGRALAASARDQLLVANPSYLA
jgi:aminoglycoside phosphotransferase (APT) family kinase protein